MVRLPSSWPSAASRILKTRPGRTQRPDSFAPTGPPLPKVRSSPSLVTRVTSTWVAPVSLTFHATRTPSLLPCAQTPAGSAHSPVFPEASIRATRAFASSAGAASAGPVSGAPEAAASDVPCDGPGAGDWLQAARVAAMAAARSRAFFMGGKASLGRAVDEARTLTRGLLRYHAAVFSCLDEECT